MRGDVFVATRDGIAATARSDGGDTATGMKIMQRFALSHAAAAAILCLATPPSRAQTTGDAPWCAVTEQGAGWVVHDCQYWSAAECAPHVIAGDRGFCNLNPYFQGAYPAPGALPQKHYRHRARHS